MNNEKILEAARNNGNRGHEHESNVEDRASLLTLASILIVGMILFIIDYFAKGVLNVSLLTVGVTAIASDLLYKGIINKKIWRIVLGVILSLVALIMIIAQVVLV